MGIIEDATASAVSLVVSGNTGVTAFLTLLLVGIIERNDPDILQMDERLENLLASNIGIGVLAVATLLEFVSMCVPIVDEMVDGAMTFLIPFISAVASMSTFGLFSSGGDDEEGERMLEQRMSVGPFQIFLILIGIGLALSLHFFKMIVRLFGEGWATGCLTILESIWTIGSIFLVIFIQPIAILIAIVLLVVAAYAVYRFVQRIQKRRADNNNNNTTGDAQEPAATSAVEMGDATTYSPPPAAPPKREEEAPVVAAAAVSIPSAPVEAVAIAEPLP